MPIYIYRCNTCDTNFEVMQKMSEQPMSICDKCGEAVVRVISPAGVIFKGSGFYKTDYGSNGSGKKDPAKAPATTPPCSNSDCGANCPANGKS